MGQSHVVDRWAESGRVREEADWVLGSLRSGGGQRGLRGGRVGARPPYQGQEVVQQPRPVPLQVKGWAVGQREDGPAEAAALALGPDGVGAGGRGAAAAQGPEQGRADPRLLLRGAADAARRVGAGLGVQAQRAGPVEVQAAGAGLQEGRQVLAARVLLAQSPDAAGANGAGAQAHPEGGVGREDDVVVAAGHALGIHGEEAAHLVAGAPRARVVPREAVGVEEERWATWANESSAGPARRHAPPSRRALRPGPIQALPSTPVLQPGSAPRRAPQSEDAPTQNPPPAWPRPLTCATAWVGAAVRGAEPSSRGQDKFPVQRQ